MRYKESFFKNLLGFIIKSATASICAATVFFTGIFAADMLPENLLNIPAKTKHKISCTIDIATSPSSYSIAKEYIIALTDSTIKFDKLPSYRIDIPFALISQLYDTAYVEKISIAGLNVKIYCTPIELSKFDVKTLQDNFEDVYGIDRSDIIVYENNAVISLYTVP